MDQKLAPEVQNEFVDRWEPVYRSRLHYLVTWSTRGRKPVLRDRHLQALSTIVRQACDQRGFVLTDVAGGTDHVHVLVALKPTQSVASVVRELKGRAAVSLVSNFPELRVWLRGHLLWDERYAVETVSALRIDAVRERLRTMHGAGDDLAQAS